MTQLQDSAECAVDTAAVQAYTNMRARHTAMLLIQTCSRSPNARACIRADGDGALHGFTHNLLITVPLCCILECVCDKQWPVLHLAPVFRALRHACGTSGVVWDDGRHKGSPCCKQGLFVRRVMMKPNCVVLGYSTLQTSECLTALMLITFFADCLTKPKRSSQPHPTQSKLGCCTCDPCIGLHSANRDTQNITMAMTSTRPVTSTIWGGSLNNSN